MQGVVDNHRVGSAPRDPTADPDCIDATAGIRIPALHRLLAAGALYVDDGFVFTAQLGGQPSPGAISHAIRRIAARAKLSVRGVHAMRHSTGSWLIHAGVDVRTVAAVLRHSSASTTLNVYAHEIEGAQAQAVTHLLGAHGNRLAPRRDRASKKRVNIKLFPRREWDSNPRTAQHRLRFSRPLH